MADKPTSHLDWATNANRREEPSALKATGYQYEDYPAAKHINWLWGQAGDWIEWLEENLGIPASPTVSMEVVVGGAGVDDTIKLKAGHYRIGGSVHSLATDFEWETDMLDTGSYADSTWYYMYAYLNGSDIECIASLTPPTNRFNTNLSGTDYDINNYVGAFRGWVTAQNKVHPFTQNGNLMFINGIDRTSASSGDLTLTIPETANVAICEMAYDNSNASQPQTARFESWSNSLTTSELNSVIQNERVYFTKILPLRYPQKITIGDAVGTIYCQVTGWYDKWL